jgi:hypothetical protein
MKLVIALVMWLASTHVAFARIKPYVETDPPRARADGEATELRVSQFPDQRLGEQHYDLYCPHTIEPNPLIVLAPDLDQPLEDAEGMAGMLARAGFVVIALAPPGAASRYLAALQGVLDQAVQALPEHLEPGASSRGLPKDRRRGIGGALGAVRPRDHGARRDGVVGDPKARLRRDRWIRRAPSRKACPGQKW